MCADEYLASCVMTAADTSSKCHNTVALILQHATQGECQNLGSNCHAQTVGLTCWFPQCDGNVTLNTKSCAFKSHYTVQPHAKSTIYESMLLMRWFLVRCRCAATCTFRQCACNTPAEGHCHQVGRVYLQQTVTHQPGTRLTLLPASSCPRMLSTPG